MKLTLTAKRQRGFNQETVILARGLGRLGWKVAFLDWRYVIPPALAGRRGLLRTDPLRVKRAMELLRASDVVVNRYLGSLRQNWLAPTLFYFDVLRRECKGLIINHLHLFEPGRTKHYLIHLHTQGLPVVPSVYLPSRLSLDTVLKMADERAWVPAVLKPVDGELCQDVCQLPALTHRAYEQMRERTAGFLLQPFLRGVVDGQRSLILVIIGSEPIVVYAMRKKPAGWLALASSSRIEEVRHTSAEADIARRVFAVWPAQLMKEGFARVDFLYDGGNPYVLEVEIVNPRGGLEQASPSSARKYVECFAEMLRTACGVL